MSPSRTWNTPQLTSWGAHAFSALASVNWAFVSVQSATFAAIESGSSGSVMRRTLGRFSKLNSELTVRAG